MKLMVASIDTADVNGASMDENDRVGVNIVVTGASAITGFALAGPGGAAIAAVVPVLVQGAMAKRKGHVEDAADQACDLAGFDGTQLATWVRGDERHAAIFHEAIEAAWSALDAAKVRTLGYVLADGMQDEARLDIDQLVIRAVREMEAGHVRVLAWLVSSPTTRSHLNVAHPLLADGMASVLATLQRVGAIFETEKEDPGNVDDNEVAPTMVRAFAATGFGKRCLQMINAAGGYSHS